MLIKVNICYKISVRSTLFIGILNEENLDMLIPFLERGIMLLSLRSRYLRTGRPGHLRILKFSHQSCSPLNLSALACSI